LGAASPVIFKGAGFDFFLVVPGGCPILAGLVYACPPHTDAVKRVLQAETLEDFVVTERNLQAEILQERSG